MFLDPDMLPDALLALLIILFLFILTFAAYVLVMSLLRKDRENPDDEDKEG